MHTLHNEDKAELYLPPMQTLDPGSSLVSVSQNYPILLLKTALRTLKKHLGFSLSTAFGKVTQLKKKFQERHLSEVFMFYFNLLFFNISVETYMTENFILYTNNLTYTNIYPIAVLSGHKSLTGVFFLAYQCYRASNFMMICMYRVETLKKFALLFKLHKLFNFTGVTSDFHKFSSEQNLAQSLTHRLEN